MQTVRRRVWIRQNLLNPLVNSYLPVNQPPQEPIYRFALIPLQNPACDLMRQVIEVRKIRGRRHGDASASKDDKGAFFLGFQEGIRKIHVSYAHVSPGSCVVCSLYKRANEATLYR